MKNSHFSFLLLVLFIFHSELMNAQGKIEIRANVIPKYSINQFNSVNGNLGDRYAMAHALDANLMIGYKIKKNTLLAGFGTYQIVPLFRPSSWLFGKDIKQVRRPAIYYHIPIEYERLVWQNKQIKISAGLGISMIFEGFKNYKTVDNPYFESVYHKDGSKISDMSVIYNDQVKTFGLLYSSTVSCEYVLTQLLSFRSAIQYAQGLRTIVNSGATYSKYDSDKDLLFKETQYSLNNGQSIMLQLGLILHLK